MNSTNAKGGGAARKGAPSLDMTNIPRHIAIIMDGNGRWAKKRGLPRTAGHAAGAETFRKIAKYCKRLGVEYLTVYAFSTENWKRPAEEVGAIMKLLEDYLNEAIVKMRKEGIRIKILGDIQGLSPKIRELIRKTEELSQGMEGCQANLCINYGGRDEIVRAINALSEKIKNGETVTEEMVSDNLYTKGIPDPELIIRPSGELRLSNFLLWQCAYSEFYFDDVLWPDFSEENMERAIIAYQNRERRFGGI